MYVGTAASAIDIAGANTGRAPASVNDLVWLVALQLTPLPDAVAGRLVAVLGASAGQPLPAVEPRHARAPRLDEPGTLAAMTQF